MRDRNINKADIRKKLNDVDSFLQKLKRLFRMFNAEFGKLPSSCVIELQHLCMHRTALHVPDLSRDLLLKHASSAVGHGRRAVLDAQKEFVLKWKTSHGLTPEQQNKFAKCRVSEIYGGFKDNYTNIEAGYSDLINDLQSVKPLRVIKENAIPPDETYWKMVQTWLELDALMSSLTLDASKHKEFIENFIQSLFFSEAELKMNPTRYLQITVDSQKLHIAALILHDKNACAEVIQYARKTSRLPSLENALTNMRASKGDDERMDYVNKEIFPLIAEFYDLKFS